MKAQRLILAFFLFASLRATEIEVRGQTEEKGFERTAEKINLNSGAESAGASGVSEVISRQSGAHVNRYGPPGSHSNLMIRGGNPEQAGVFFEGIPLNDPFGGGFNLENLPIALFSEADLYPAATPLHLPGSHIAGALDLRLAILPADETRLLFNSGIHSLQGGFLGTGIQNKNSLHYAEASGSRNIYQYRDDGGTPFLNTADDKTKYRRNEDYLQGGYTGFQRFNLSTGKLDILTDIFLKERGLPGVIGQEAESVRLKNDRALVAARWKQALGDQWLLEASAFSQWNRSRLLDPAQELAAGYEDLSRTAYMGGFGAGVRWYLPFAEFRLRTDGRQTHLRENSTAHADRTEIDTGLATELRPWPRHGRLLLSAKTNYTRDLPYRETRGLPGYSERSGVQPSLLAHAGIFPLGFLDSRNNSPETLEIYAAVSQNQRFPTLAENYGDGGLLLPAPGLRNETALTNATGLRGEIPCGIIDCKVRLEYFLTAMDNLILFIANSQRTMVAVNAGRAQLEGLETDLRVGFRNFFSLTVRYQYLSARDLGVIPYYYGKYLPYRPMHSFFSMIEGGGKFLRFFAGGDFIGRNYRDRYNSYHLFLESRVRLLSGLIWRVDGTQDKELSLVVRNITDEQQVDVIGYPLPGRVYEIRYRQVWKQNHDNSN